MRKTGRLCCFPQPKRPVFLANPIGVPSLPVPVGIGNLTLHLCMWLFCGCCTCSCLILGHYLQGKNLRSNFRMCGRGKSTRCRWVVHASHHDNAKMKTTHFKAHQGPSFWRQPQPQVLRSQQPNLAFGGSMVRKFLTSETQGAETQLTLYRAISCMRVPGGWNSF